LIEVHAQTVLSAGDIAIIGFKTNNNTDGGNDAIKLLVLRELDCNTSFIVTDNNWNRTTNSWFCDNDEFAVQLTVTSTILAGSIIYIEVDAAGNPVSSSTGSITKASLGNPWGSNFGLNSGGDNIFVLQGTRSAPTFIYGVRHNGTFATGGDCASGGTPRNNTALPAGLTLGTTAIQMASSQNQWHYDCASASTSRFINNRSTLLTNISNNANWVSTAGQQWNASSCTFNILDQPFIQNGSVGVFGAGCGCISGCNLSTVGGPNCGTGTSGDCLAGQVNMSVDIPVPAGCNEMHFAWHFHHSFILPKGYSALFTHPLNRHDLPFTTLSGIVDGGIKMDPNGNIPFYLKENFEGIIEQGTPIAQLIPFRQENWKSIKTEGLAMEGKLHDLMASSVFKGWYKNNFWKQKKYQ
jgi:hypothetical protein